MSHAELRNLHSIRIDYYIRASDLFKSIDMCTKLSGSAHL